MGGQRSVDAAAVAGDPAMMRKMAEELREELNAVGKSSPDGIDVLRLKYRLYGKREWWFIMDEVLEAVSKELQENDYVIMDGFLEKEKCDVLRSELVKVYEEGGVMRRGACGGKMDPPFHTPWKMCAVTLWRSLTVQRSTLHSSRVSSKGGHLYR